MFFLASWFVTIIYQPFFNLLIGIYWLLDQVTHGHADMGVAVIIFTIAFRIIWLPISLASDRSVKEQREISAKIKEIRTQFSHDPIAERKAIKQIFKSRPQTVFFSTVDIVLQVLIALMLWRIFAQGLLGADFHLLYKFMPQITHPFNLMFLGKYDLTHTNIMLNIIQSVVIFVAEALSALYSPYIISRREVIMTQFSLPIVSYLVFMFLPAGKKLFIITTLLFSIVQMTIRQIYYWITTFSAQFEKTMTEKYKKNEETKPPENAAVQTASTDKSS